MKALQIKLALLLLLFTGMVKAQIVNIPDANFKAKLIALGIDTNLDGEIQNSEALVVTSLNLSSSNIFDLTGIENLTNLSTLLCDNNQLTTLDANWNFPNLTVFDCSYNQLTSINFSSSIFGNLYFDCSHNQLVGLDVSNLNFNSLLANNNLLENVELPISDIMEVALNNNQLTSINVNNLNVSIFNCENNNLTEININNCDIFDFQTNSFATLQTFTFTNSNEGYFLMSMLGYTSLVTVDYTNSNVASLGQVRIDSPQLQSLNLTNTVGLNEIVIENSLLNSIILPVCDLMTFECINNSQLAIINTSLLQSTDGYEVGNCPLLTSLDLSNFNTPDYQIYNNILLKSINIRNGHDDSNGIIDFQNLPLLEFICVDDIETQFVQTYADNNSITAAITNYCSFTPGGNYNTISGNIKLDANNNGCDTSDLPQPNIRVNINDGTNTVASFTSTTGDYKFYTQAGSFDITPEIENPSFFNFTPSTATIPFANNNNNSATQNFCISANGVHPDLEVVLAPIIPARPGFDATYKLVYKNKGNQTLSGSVNLVFDDAKTDFVSANPIVDNLAVNSLTWNYNNLLPFESRSIDVVLNVNSPLETPAVNIDDILNFVATINPISGDELPDDNTFVYNQTVVGSYDPNDIACLEGNSVAPSEIGEYLHYVINFENTGNYPAENVVVKTIVDTTKFDVNSLQLLNTSNPVDARIAGNVVEFIFENIQLGGPGGHGHILLKIKSKNTLVAGDAVAKNANIYFDYNAPVDTGMATTVFQSLSNTMFEKDDSINVSPNPTNSKININCNNNVKKIELYDVQGRILETQIGETKSFDISEKASGIYFLKITTEKGSKVEKVVKK